MTRMPIKRDFECYVTNFKQD